MRIQRCLAWLAFTMLVVGLTACGQRAQTPAVVAGTTQAAVRSVEILRDLNEPAGFHVLVQGELADGCSRLGKTVVQQGGTLFAIILPSERVDRSQCSSGPVDYERVIPLSVDGLQPGRYTVMVNGTTVYFELKKDPVPSAVVEEGLPTRIAPQQTEPTATPPPDQPSPTPTVTPPDTTVNVEVVGATIPESGGPCINKAAFYEDITIPDGTTFDPGQAFIKTWRVRNAGTCTWDAYSLVFIQGELLAASDRQVLAQTVNPGDVVDISLPMTAPDQPGGYTSEWQFGSSDGAQFGLGAAGDASLWAKIGVRSMAPTPRSPDDGPIIECTWAPNDDFESEVFTLINRERRERGLSAFQRSEAVSQVSRVHSQDMACNDFVEHYGSDGSTYISRVQAAGISFRGTSENIYAGTPSFGGNAEAAVRWWMNSQIHRDAILNPRFSVVGIGYAYYGSSTYQGYFTLNFIEP